MYILDNKLVSNCILIIEDVKSEEDILGPIVTKIKGINSTET